MLITEPTWIILQLNDYNWLRTLEAYFYTLRGEGGLVSLTDKP